MMLPKWEVLLLGAAIIAAFFAGWKVKSWQVDSRDLAIAQARDAMIAEYRVNEAGKARMLEEKLASLKANERVIEREKLKIIDRPVYHNTCLDDDGLRLIEAARSGKTNPAEPTDAVPGAK